MRKQHNAIRRNSKIKFWLFIFLFAAVGSYFLFVSQAAVSNPPLTRACGLDVALLIDGSTSMNGRPYTNAQAGMEAFASALKGTDTYIAVRRMDGAESKAGEYESLEFSKDTATVLRNIGTMQRGQYSHLTGLGEIQESDPRPNRQNLIIVLSDFEIEYDQAGVNAAKQSGTRILALVYNLDPPDPEEDAARDATVTAIAGPKFNTGSIFTSDVVHVDPSTIGAQFKSFARQLCFSGTTPGPNGSSGPGHGTGSNGTGSGSGGGGGGSTAKTQSDKPNTTPSSSHQGDKKPPELNPSPFYDGKLYLPGSDPIDKVLGNISIGGKRILHGWLYLFGLFFILTSLAAAYFLWWRRMSVAEQVRIKRKLHLTR